MEVMEAFAELMEAFTDLFMFMEASVEAAMEYMEDMKASTGVTSTEASTKSFATLSLEVTSTTAAMEAFMEEIKTFVEVMESFMEVTSTEVFHGRYGRY